MSLVRISSAFQKCNEDIVSAVRTRGEIKEASTARVTYIGIAAILDPGIDIGAVVILHGRKNIRRFLRGACSEQHEYAEAQSSQGFSGQWIKKIQWRHALCVPSAKPMPVIRQMTDVTMSIALTPSPS